MPLASLSSEGRCGKTMAERLIIQGGNVVTESDIIIDALVFVEDGKIESIGSRDSALCYPFEARIIDAAGHWVCPGFVDVHVHGGGGGAFNGDKEQVRLASRFLASTGTTSFLATIGTLPKEDTFRAIENVVGVMDEGTDGAEIVGLHMEGPFVNPERKGAMNPEFMRRPSIEEADQMMKVSNNKIKLMTIAPEIEGAHELISHLCKIGVVASMGHSNATYQEACGGIAAGIQHITHTYNAMRGLHHREPGGVGAALTQDLVICELIADFVHVAPAAAMVLIRAKGPDRTAIITDSSFAAGLPDGKYSRGDGRYAYVRDGRCTLEDGTLAGSISTMNRSIANLVRGLNISIIDAIKMASLTPARSVGISDAKGSLCPGKDADIVILDENFQVLRTFVRGREVYCKE